MARSVTAVVPLPAEGVILLTTIPGHVAEALVTGQADAVGVLLLHDAENRASPGLLPRRVEGAKEAQIIVGAALVVDLPVMEATWTPAVVA